MARACTRNTQGVDDDPGAVPLHGRAEEAHRSPAEGTKPELVRTVAYFDELEAEALRLRRGRDDARLTTVDPDLQVPAARLLEVEEVIVGRSAAESLQSLVLDEPHGFVFGLHGDAENAARAGASASQDAEAFPVSEGRDHEVFVTKVREGSDDGDEARTAVAEALLELPPDDPRVAIPRDVRVTIEEHPSSSLALLCAAKGCVEPVQRRAARVLDRDVPTELFRLGRGRSDPVGEEE